MKASRTKRGNVKLVMTEEQADDLLERIGKFIAGQFNVFDVVYGALSDELHQAPSPYKTPAVQPVSAEDVEDFPGTVQHFQGTVFVPGPNNPTPSWLRRHHPAHYFEPETEGL